MDTHDDIETHTRTVNEELLLTPLANVPKVRHLLVEHVVVSFQFTLHPAAVHVFRVFNYLIWRNVDGSVITHTHRESLFVDRSQVFFQNQKRRRRRRNVKLKRRKRKNVKKNGRKCVANAQNEKFFSNLDINVEETIIAFHVSIKHKLAIQVSNKLHSSY